MIELIGTLAIPLLLTEFGFALVASAVAWNRDRRVVTWFVLGALLGPIALLLVAFAPPGRCESCDAPVDGWPSHCTACGALLPTPLPSQDDPTHPAPANAPGLRPVSTPSVTPGAAPPSAMGVDHADAWLNPAPLGPGPQHHDAPPIYVDLELSTAARVGAIRPSDAVAGSAGPQTGAMASNAPQRSGRSRAAETVPLAAAMFLAGSSACQPGLHYTLATRGDAFIVLGPLETKPTAVAVRRRLQSIGAVTSDGDRLLISNDGGRGIRSWTLVFQHIKGASTEEIQRALLQTGVKAGST